MYKTNPIIQISANPYLEKVSLKHTQSLFQYIDQHRYYLSEFVD